MSAATRLTISRSRRTGRSKAAPLNVTIVVARENHASQVFVHIGNGGGMLEDLLSESGSFTDSRLATEEMSVALTLARQIILLHHGRLYLRIDPDLGLDSVVQLPAGVCG